MFKYRVILVLTTTIIYFLINGCSSKENSSQSKSESFNFRDTVKIESVDMSNDSLVNSLRIAVAAITSPRETFTYYEQMFKYIEEQLGMKVLMIQRKTYKEVNDLLKTNEVDIAFICSGGYVHGIADSAFKLLVVPERDGLRKYQTYIIVHRNSNFQSLEELKGKRFAFTDPLSTAGTLYPTRRIKDLNSNPKDFFSSFIYTYAHDNSIQLVAKQMVDGASVNSLVFDFLKIVSPERTKNIRIIETSEWHGMPPVVIAHGVDDEFKTRIQNIFLNIHRDEGSKKVLERLMVDRYVIESDTIYRSVRDLVDFENISD